MKFKFKIQQYQTDAVESTVNVFAGQPSKTNAQYRRDLGKQKQQLKAEFEEEYVGYRNADVELNASQLLENGAERHSAEQVLDGHQRPRCLLVGCGDGDGHGQDLRLYQDHVRDAQTLRLVEVHRGGAQHRHPRGRL